MSKHFIESLGIRDNESRLYINASNVNIAEISCNMKAKHKIIFN